MTTDTEFLIFIYLKWVRENLSFKTDLSLTPFLYLLHDLLKQHRV